MREPPEPHDERARVCARDESPRSLWPDLRLDRATLIAWSVATIALSGVRFSDGSLLRAISAGATASDPQFIAPHTHYVWDSPLKISLLRLIPSRIVVIAGAFLLIALLPLLGLLYERRSSFYKLTGLSLLLTPILKVSVQNVGLGDGLVFLAVMVAVCTESYPVQLAALYLVGTWHPQQQVFVCLSWLLGRLIASPGSRLDAATVSVAVLAIVGSGLTAWLFRCSLGFEYDGRLSYLLTHAPGFWLRNLVRAPVALFFAAYWTWCVVPALRTKTTSVQLASATWLVALMGVALLTKDVSRVFCLVCFPLVLSVAKEAVNEETREMRIPLWFALPSILIPIWSWSGWDYLLWPDLLRDLCKHQLYCF